MRKMMSILAVLLLGATTVPAADYSDLYVIPIAGHAVGLFGTSWRSDVVLHNFQDVPITVEMVLIESGRDATSDAIDLGEPLQIAPGETRVIEDVLGALGRDTSGAVLVGADLPFAVTSRTYSESPGRRTIGQTVLPIGLAAEADAISEVSVLAALAQNAAHRSNVGLFIAASRAPFTAEIEILTASGAPLGSAVVTVSAEGLAHRQFAASSLAPAADGVTAIVRILQGDGIVVPYASTIDNATAEALFTAGVPATSGGSAARAMIRAAIGVSRIE